MIYVVYPYTMSHEGLYSASSGQTQIILHKVVVLPFSKQLLNCFSAETRPD
jgi:hypothetical protein